MLLRSILKLALLSQIVLFTTLVFFYGKKIPNPTTYKHFYKSIVSNHRNSFIESALAAEVGGEFNGTALAALCSSRTWIPGLIFSCEEPLGGYGNVRSMVLGCVRCAIEVGGMSLPSNPEPKLSGNQQQGS